MKTFDEIILDKVYPVGAIYMSVNNTNPGTLFGGTWSAWGTGRVPVGIDTNDSDFNTVEKTGGEKTHTLVANEMPTHDHGQFVAANPNTGGTGIRGDFNGTEGSGLSAYTQGIKTDTAGADQAHNNLQPYIVCYMWKRTA